MSIKTIEMICIPCQKCVGIEAKVREMVKGIELINKIKIPFEFKHTTKLLNISQYSLNPSQTPAIIINGIVEFAGGFDPILMKRRLEAIHKTC
ncbi:MAG: hypothetical protein AUJ74_02480 [Candidatus Omnitrophica bacterium CG1_02_44_16]|nr:MAG: hypothetical protein AUJ74_02480 [Candidatus Omnitrophica bacterium CG1_02_44_16]PIY82519.1 MAG: hypothetical protein COY78_06715 [Candidatus Omnitrophica bacterium CG_4_10_14_0_8_um_filter_44_12]PIZ85103.1 MAG: hypothetical protein COX96_00305 [Candidatus Omnitrophica bacterium CG_4_10_14_0_2_um_filter_44_9]